MLNLGVDINIDIRKPHMPIHFERRNECVHCGARNSLKFVDKFGRATNKEINAFNHIKCENCGRVYSIQWDSDEETGNMFPSAVEYNIGKQFSNFIKKGNIAKNGLPELE